MRFLVVDDSSTMRRIIINTLNKLGHKECHEAGNGREGVDKLATTAVDMVITDWNMPEMSGLDLVKWARGSEQFADMPILMITTRGNKDDVIEAMKMRVNNYIVKPFTAPGLKEKIDQILKSVGGAAA